MLYDAKTNPWTIEADGTMVHKENNYYIAGYRLNEDNWIAHMAEKSWVDLRAFLAAYFAACCRRGLTTVSLDPRKIF